MAEAWRNTAARPARFSLLALVMFLVCMALALVESITSHNIDSATAAAIAAGATTIKITGDPTTPITARSCAGLDNQAGIVAAGGIDNVHKVYAATSPGLAFTMADSTGDLVGTLTGHPSAQNPAGLVIPSQIAQELGSVPGGVLSIGGSVFSVASIQPLDQRDQTLGRTVLSQVAPTGTVSACYVQFGVGAFSQGMTLVQQYFTGIKGLNVAILDANGPLTDPDSLWTHRTTQYGWVVAGLILAVFFVFAARSRRPEHAVYLIVGSPRAPVAMLFLAEQAIVVATATLATFAWHALFCALMGAD